VWKDVTRALNELRERESSLNLVRVKDASLVVALVGHARKSR
jgi:hypothetical protein